MSRISRYQESLSRFIKTKSPYSEIIKPNNKIESLLDISEHEATIMLLTIFNGQKKKKKFKSHEPYSIASGIHLLMSIVMINDSLNYYKTLYGDAIIKNFISQAPAYVYECLSKNLETLENAMDKEKIPKLQSKIYSFFNKKMVNITKYEELKAHDKVHKTDIIKYKFNNKNIIELKYRKLKAIDKDVLVEYVERTYGATCQCALVLGWLLSVGEEKQINNFERLGTHLGLLIKLSNDFKNLERDIMNADTCSYNLIVNCGIHECFALFDESKVKILEGCFTLNIYSTTVKEIIDHIEKTFDTYLKNTELELASKYTSFSTQETNNCKK